MTFQTATRRELGALIVLQLTAIGVVLAVVPYKAFDLDRFFVPKELVLHAGAGIAALLILVGRRRISGGVTDLLLIAFLVMSAVSAVFATNWWLAGRALAITASGLALYAVATILARAGLGRWVVATAAIAAIIGASTALLQAYFGPITELFSINRAPGGTYGNRNFMAHVAAMAAPVVVLVALGSRQRIFFAIGTLGTLVLAAAIVLSRSRGAWLAVGAAATVVTAVALLARVQLGRGHTVRRIALIGLAAAAGVAMAVSLPNRLEWRSDSPYLESVRDVVNYREGSGAGRLAQYSNSLGMVRADPLLGVGPGNWTARYSEFASRRDPSLGQDTGTTDNPWPSSDWVAFVAERGVAAALLIGLAFLAIVWRAVADLLRARGTDEPERLVANLMVIGVVTSTVVVGMFDAVLLLAAPTTFFWIVTGALSPPQAPRFSIEYGVAEFAPVLAALLILLGAGRSGLQLGAMGQYTMSTSSSSLAHAAKLDPGSYRIRLRAAERFLARGDCRSARAHARAASALFPNATAPRRVIRACG